MIVILNFLFLDSFSAHSISEKIPICKRGLLSSPLLFRVETRLERFSGARGLLIFFLNF